MIDWKIIAGFISGISLAAIAIAIRSWWRQRRTLRKGRLGEKMVAKTLSSLDRRDFIVLNDLLLPTTSRKTSQIDHLVISTRGLFVIETKNLAGRISGSEHSQYWQQHLSSETKSIYNPVLQNHAHIRAIRRLLRDVDAELFVSVVVFTDAWRLDIKADDIIIPRTLLPDKHIRRTLIPVERRKKRWWCLGQEIRLDEQNIVTSLDDLRKELLRRPRVLDRDDLPSIAESLRSANLTDGYTRREHVKYARRTSANVSADIRKGICPQCHAGLVTRKANGHEFIGCSRYPACRFTCSIDRLPTP